MNITHGIQLGATRQLPDGRRETEAVSFVQWECPCGRVIRSLATLFNTETTCACDRRYVVTWGHGIQPQVIAQQEVQL